jgi:hypothetical protein
MMDQWQVGNAYSPTHSCISHLLALQLTKVATNPSQLIGQTWKGSERTGGWWGVLTSFSALMTAFMKKIEVDGSLGRNALQSWTRKSCISRLLRNLFSRSWMPTLKSAEDFLLGSADDVDA